MPAWLYTADAQNRPANIVATGQIGIDAGVNNMRNCRASFANEYTVQANTFYFIAFQLPAGENLRFATVSGRAAGCCATMAPRIPATVIWRTCPRSLRSSDRHHARADMPPFDKLLVLDIDETLVHANERLACPPHFEVGPYQVVLRPHVDRFLAFALSHFARVGVWTSASRGHAEPLLDRLLDRSRLTFVWCVDRCGHSWDTESGEMHALKDLRKLRKRGHDPTRPGPQPNLVAGQR